MCSFNKLETILLFHKVKMKEEEKLNGYMDLAREQ